MDVVRMREEQAHFAGGANADWARRVDGRAFSAGAMAMHDHRVVMAIRDPGVELADPAIPAMGESRDVCGFNGGFGAQECVELRGVVGHAGEAVA